MRITPRVAAALAALLAAALAGPADAGTGSPVSAADLPGLRAEAGRRFGALPARMPGSEQDTPERVALGRRLYTEPALSVNGKQSCNDCHRLDGGRAGVDNEPTSTGARGDRGGRNAPTVLNAGFQIAQFWDGRAPDLAHQAMGPPLNPIEMGMPSGEACAQRLADAGYTEDFRRAFPNADPPVSFERMAEAIAAYERTLVTRARLDDFLAGADTALTTEEQRGLASFINQGCADCHAGPTLGGQGYAQLGVSAPYHVQTDPGRAKVTGQADDTMVFKVALLRNITLTAPYFHHGGVATLGEAVDEMARHQLGHSLPEGTLRDVLCFLTALSDPARTTGPPAAQAPPDWRAPDPATLAVDSPGRYGLELVTRTAARLWPAVGKEGNALSCTSCHQDSGTKAYGLAWAGVARKYPAPNARWGRTVTVAERINDCLERSLNGSRLATDSRELQAMVAYLAWLGADQPARPVGLAPTAITPPDRAADPQAGQQVYTVYCQSCHGDGGEGYQRPTGDRAVQPPPLWGPRSYNNGAGLARVLTLAAFVRANMPLGSSWHRTTLSDAQAYDVAAYVNSQPRPQRAGLERDYPDLTLKPVDCPYGPYADGAPAAQHKYGPFGPLQGARPAPR